MLSKINLVFIPSPLLGSARETELRKILNSPNKPAKGRGGKKSPNRKGPEHKVDQHDHGVSEPLLGSDVDRTPQYSDAANASQGQNANKPKRMTDGAASDTSDTPHSAKALQAGILYVVPTPIGNLDDMVPRAREVLQQVSLIAAEDTRHSRPLMQHFGINTPIIAYHDHNQQAAGENLIARLMAGESIALISDAGTPLVSDPGYRLVDACHSQNITVIPIPGACAAIAALSAAGLASDRFIFEGFLPAKSHARQQRLMALADETRTLMFYEAPHRVRDTVADMREVFGGERTAVLAREITKMFETIKRAPLDELFEFIDKDSNQQRGEIVLLVAGAVKQEGDVSQQSISTLTLLMQELPLKKAAAIAAKLTGERKNALYNLGLELQNKS